MKWFKTEYRIVKEYLTGRPSPAYSAEMRMLPLFTKWEYVGGTVTYESAEKAEQKLREARAESQQKIVIKKVQID